jgi:hypothetical protein
LSLAQEAEKHVVMEAMWEEGYICKEAENPDILF